MRKKIEGFDPNALTVGRARSEDTKFIKKLLNPQTFDYFGQDDVEELLCKSYLSLTVRYKTDGIVATACFNNYPNVPSIAPSCWEEWVKALYGLREVNAGNTLWVHLMVCDQKYARVFLRPLLGYLFATCRFVEKVLLVFPPKRRVFGWLEDRGTEIVPVGCANIERVQTLFLIHRQHHVLPYKLRRAVEQDNDEIVSLLHKHCPRLVELYGKFYAAKIVADSNLNRQVIVVEYKGCVVVVFGLNGCVNYDVMNTAFELETFYGFRKPDERDSMEEYDWESGQSATTDFGEVITKKYNILSLGELSKSDLSTSSGREKTASEIMMAYYFYLSDTDLVLQYFDSSASSSIVDFTNTLPLSKLSSEVVETYLKSKLSCLLLTHKEVTGKRWSRKENKLNIGFVPDGHTMKPRVSKFYGQPNAFALELFAAEKEHINALSLILEGAFECYPDRDYCICTTPSVDLNLPLFDICVRAVPRPTSNFHHELYASHRSANYKRVTVRSSNSSDVPSVKKLLNKMKIRHEILPAFIGTLDPNETDRESYAFLCGDDLVGFSIVSEEKEVSYIKSHYKITNWTDISRYKLGQHGTIHYFVLSPIFQKHVSFLLLELHRLSGYSILYFKLTPKELHSSIRVLPAALCTLLPVLPTKIPEYNFIQKTSTWVLPDVLKVPENPFALYISTPMHCSLPRFENNTKIVVVGGSDVGISFLINLIFRQNPNYKLTFNNITLIAPHGVSRNVNNEIRNLLLQNASDYTTQYLTLLSLRTYINIVTGVMSHINRKEKYITVNGTFLPYDVLFLMCGKQYQMPLLEKYSDGKLQCPNNVMIINTEIDAEAAMLKLESLLKNRPSSSYTIVVYGCTLDAFCCLSALLEWGVPGSNITFVEPDDDDRFNHHSVFNDDDVLKAVLHSIQEQNIKLHYGYNLGGWEIDYNEEVIKSVTFQTCQNKMTIPCLALFVYTPKTISSRTLVAVHQAGLIVDGSLVISQDGSTNDPYIYAAGTMTKYPRRYYADHMKHENFNRKEIGHRLAELIQEKLVPEIHELEQESFISQCTKSKNLVPQYVQPLTTYCVLPGNLRYLNIRKPGLQVPLEIALSKDNYGQVLISGNIKNLQAQGYFRLHLNQFQTVETITCLTRYDISRANIEALWGKHETFLNHLVQRFELMEISDLLEFFSEPWSCALVHEAFADCQEKCFDVMASLAVKSQESIIEDLLVMFKEKNWSKFTEKENQVTLEKFRNSKYQTKVTDVLMDFLIQNELCLPMYANSVLAKVILANYENSPFFKPT